MFEMKSLSSLYRVGNIGIKLKGASAYRLDRSVQEYVIVW